MPQSVTNNQVFHQQLPSWILPILQCCGRERMKQNDYCLSFCCFFFLRVVIIFEKYSTFLIRPRFRAVGQRKHNPGVGLIAVLHDIASLAVAPTLERSACNWPHCLWIRSHLIEIISKLWRCPPGTSRFSESPLLLCALPLSSLCVHLALWEEGKSRNI